MGQPPTTSNLEKISLLQSLEQARKFCESLPGTIPTNRLETLPAFLNDINYWLNDNNPLENGTVKLGQPFAMRAPSVVPSSLSTPSIPSNLPEPNSQHFGSFTLFDPMPHSPQIISPSPTNENAMSPFALTSPVSGSPLSASVDEGGFKCSIAGCKRTFKRVDHLRRHIRCHADTPLYKKAIERRRSQSNIHAATSSPFMSPHTFPMMSSLFGNSSTPTLMSPSLTSPATSGFLGTPTLSAGTPYMDQHTLLSPFFSGLNVGSSTPTMDLNNSENAATAALLAQSLNEAFQSPFLSFSSLDAMPFTPAQLESELKISEPQMQQQDQKLAGLGLMSDDMQSFAFLEGELASAFDLVDSALDMSGTKTEMNQDCTQSIWNTL